MTKIVDFKRHFGFAAALAAASLLVPVAAQADELEEADRLSIDVGGRIPERCSIESAAGIDFGDLNRPNLHAQRHLGFYCNVPFSVQMTSRNGGLVNSVYPTGQGPYAGRLRYTLGVDVPVRKPRSRIISKEFSSADMVGGVSFSSEGGIAIEGLDLRFAMSRPASEAGLLAGEYSEVIEITVQPI